MTWMLTARGEEVSLEFVAADSIDIRTIAHHLAQINRFTGACRRPYSVAEHSLLVSDILRDRGAPPAVQFAGLLHDAHEAYTNDISTPAKLLLGDAWHALESRVEDAVHRQFGLPPILGAAGVRDAIKHADLTALVTERQHLLPPSACAWPAEQTHAPISWYSFTSHTHTTWDRWRIVFLERYLQLLQQLPTNEGAT